MNQRLQRSTNADIAAWDLAAELREHECYWARRALIALDVCGEATDLNAELTPRGLATLDKAERWALRHLWTLARDRGLRTRALPRRWARTEKVLREIGIDPGTTAFLHLHRSEFGGHCYEPAWWFMGQLRDRALPTDLDVDLEAGPVRAFIETVLTQGLRGPLAEMPGTSKPYSTFRGAMRILYGTARACGLRRRPIPDFIAYTRPRVSVAALWAHLSHADRERLDRLFAKLDRLTARQQADKSRPLGGHRKDTIAQTTLHNYKGLINSIVRQGLEDGWPLELDSLFQPERLTEWVYRGRNSDGLPMSQGGPKLRLALLRGVLERAADVEEPLVPRERFQDLFTALEADRGEVNVAGRRRDTDDDVRFTPSLAQILDAIAKIEEDFARATGRFERGQLTRLRYHKAFQLRTLFWCELLAMWRKDTAATIDLLLARRHTETGVVLVRGVRAKQARVGAAHYVSLILLPQAVDKIEELLRFEGRSIEEPLRDGETAVELRAERGELRNGRWVQTAPGDRWGHDFLKNSNQFAAPLWRRHPDSPEPLTYNQIDLMQRRMLRSIGWLEGIPHSLRVAGAIYLRSRGYQLDQIMEIGLWKSLEVLLTCYARLNFEDRLAEMAALAPSAHVAAPVVEQRRRTAAVVRIQRAAVELGAHGEPTLAAHEHFERTIRAALDDIARANAAACGSEWKAPAVSNVDLRELVMIDEALRQLYPDGVNELLGRPVLASARIAARRQKDAKTARPSGDHSKLLDRLAQKPRRRDPSGKKASNGTEAA